ncbi:MAG: hypothetical protein EOL87_18815 [Spartobacteria bacterium]|nr:hypothetical protein [Spartobacteria bacterium]
MSRQFMLFLANMWVFSMVLFTQRFIGRERLGKGLNCGLNVVVVGMLLGGIMVLVVSYRMSVALTHALVLAGFVAGTVVSIWVNLRHRGDSRLWLIAIPWMLMLLMAVVLMLQWHGVIPIIASVPVLLRVMATGVSMLFLLALFEKQLAALRQERQFLRAQRMASEARLESLRYQLNPHFLYNTLNSIEGLSVEAPQRIPALVHRLADFLRARLVPSGDFMVSFGEMLEIVKAYLEIEVVRFEERLCVEYDIAEGLATCRVPEMVLQPLVENAIKHGMMNEDPLQIRIRAWREHRRLYMRVENQGSLAHTPHATLDRSGIGARNVAEQLRHYYGDDGAEFKLSEENGWVVATVCIPVEETS